VEALERLAALVVVASRDGAPVLCVGSPERCARVAAAAAAAIASFKALEDVLLRGVRRVTVELANGYCAVISSLPDLDGALLVAVCRGVELGRLHVALRLAEGELAYTRAQR